MIAILRFSVNLQWQLMASIQFLIFKHEIKYIATVTLCLIVLWVVVYNFACSLGWVGIYISITSWIGKSAQLCHVVLLHNKILWIVRFLFYRFNVVFILYCLISSINIYPYNFYLLVNRFFFSLHFYKGLFMHFCKCYKISIAKDPSH